MRNVKFILPALLIALNFISCRKDSWKIWGKGDNITEVRDISGFSGIDLGIDANIFYQQDSIYWVEISAQSNVLSTIKTDVRGNTLDIYTHAHWMRHKTVTITIHSPEMHLLSLSGSGDIIVQNTINTTSLDLSISGSGNISLGSLAAQDVDGKISGSGNIKISEGVITDEDFHISGSGDIEALELVSNTSKLKISGSGDMEVNVVQSMEVSISGSGDVKYKGTPAIETHMSGSGNITHIN